MPAGQVTALIGPSGCGKSTFLRILNRMHELVPGAALAGGVLLDGTDIYAAGCPADRQPPQHRHGLPAAQPFPGHVDLRQRRLGAQAHRPQRLARPTTSSRSACAGPGLWPEVYKRLHVPGGALSGGQQQRLCIARALAVQPERAADGRAVLGPRPDLDPAHRGDHRRDRRADVTIVIVTHNMQQAQRVSQQCAFFLAGEDEPGRIVEHGPTAQLFNAPQDPRTADYVHGRFG